MFMKLPNQSILLNFSIITDMKFGTLARYMRFLVWFILFFRDSIQILKFRSKFFRFVLFLTSGKRNYQNKHFHHFIFGILQYKQTEVFLNWIVV